MPPRKLTFEEATVAVKKLTGESVTRMTVYNWVKKGKRGHKLQSTFLKRSIGGVAVTTDIWLEEFLRQTGAFD